jgi:uncharacterized protein
VIRYLDTSVLVKRYVHEDGSEAVQALFREAAPIASSRLAWVELHAALARRSREGTLTPAARKRIFKLAVADFEALRIVEATHDIAESAAELCHAHPLRSLDAMHLASALWLRGELDPEVEFHCADRGLSRAAKRAGLVCMDP